MFTKADCQKNLPSRKSKLVLSMQVPMWLSNIANHLWLIWLQTLVVIDSESCQTSFASFCVRTQKLCVAFKHCKSFVTDLASNFGCDQFRIMPGVVYKLLHAPIRSRCAVWVESEQTPFVRQVVDLDLLFCSVCAGFCSEHAGLFLCHIVTQRPIYDHGQGIGLQQLLSNSIENFISDVKK